MRIIPAYQLRYRNELKQNQPNICTTVNYEVRIYIYKKKREKYVCHDVVRHSSLVRLIFSTLWLISTILNSKNKQMVL